MSKKIDKDDVHRKYVFDEMAKKTKYDIKDLEKYIDSLSDDQIKRLCRHLSHSRKNGVYRFIARGPKNWMIKTIDISDIYVRRLNNSVNGHLSRNHWSLKKISKDEKIPELKEFKKKGKIHHRSLTLIAHKKEDNIYKLIDGNHRAIKLACNGETKLKLIFYER